MANILAEDKLCYRVVSSTYRESFQTEVSGLLETGHWALYGDITVTTIDRHSDPFYTQVLVRKTPFELFLDSDQGVREKYDEWEVYNRVRT